MNTALEYIEGFKNLPPEERQIVIDFVNSTNEEEEDFVITHYSDDDLAELDRRYEEAKRGINVERFSSMDEALQSLGLGSQ